MASGFGVDATIDAATGKVASSTTAQDIRRILGAMYSPGLLQGGEIITSASGMTYTVGAGVVIIKIATGQHIAAPFDTTTLSSGSAPYTGSRVDIIYVKQNFPSDGDSNAVVGVGSVLPKNAIAIAKYQVPAGVTNTNSVIKNSNVDYSIPYGVSMGVLHEFTDARETEIPDDSFTQGAGMIYLPTDRRIRFSVRSFLSAKDANGFDNSKYVEHTFRPRLDNQPLVKWTTTGLHQGWGTYQFDHYVNVPAGEHTVSLERVRQVGPGHVLQHYGFADHISWHGGTTFTVEDAGVVI